MGRSVRLGVSALLAAVASPAGAAPAQFLSGPPAPSRQAPPRLEEKRPTGAIHVPCLVRAEIEPSVAAGTLKLRFVLVGIGHEPRKVTLRGTCPGGVVDLRGLPPDFDPFLPATIDAGGPRSQTCSGAPIHVVVDRKRRGLRLASLPAAVTTEPAPTVTRVRRVAPKPKPAPATGRRRPCRPCAFACLDGVPASGVGPDGCPRCGCEDPDGSSGTRRR